MRLFAVAGIFLLALSIVAPSLAWAQVKLPTERPINLTLGGHYYAALYRADAKVLSISGNELLSVDQINLQQDAEIHIRGATRLDNGMRLSVLLFHDHN